MNKKQEKIIKHVKKELDKVLSAGFIGDPINSKQLNGLKKQMIECFEPVKRLHPEAEIKFDRESEDPSVICGTITLPMYIPIPFNWPAPSATDVPIKKKSKRKT